MGQRIILGILLLSVLFANAQDKSRIDSLEQQLLEDKLTVEEQIDILSQLAQHSPDPKQGLLYSEKLIEFSKDEGSVVGVLQGLTQKGNAQMSLGELSQALQVHLEAIDLAESTNNTQFLGINYIAMAGVYSVMDNKQNSISFYRKALAILENTEHKREYASALENLGDEYNLNYSQPDSALYYFERSGKIFRELKSKLGLAYNLGNKGLAYAQLGDPNRAENNLKEAIRLLDEQGAYSAISVYLTYMSDIYRNKGQIKQATVYAQNGLDLALKYGLKDQISDAHLKLSELAEAKGNLKATLHYYKTHIKYKDSVKNISVAQELAKQRMEFEVGKEKRETELIKAEAQSQRNLALGIGVALFLSALLAFGLYRRTLFISKTKKIIEAERNRSDKLLLNILPEQIASELKESGAVKARKYDKVSVLFSDFKGFTNYAENLSPELLVKSIGFYFSEFDRIIEKHGLEKIKTIGDSYMCASGLPFPSEDHALRVGRAALEILEFVESVKNDASVNRARFDIRIGINSGPVVAGVVGSKKFAYDIWGDTVNVASRMESMSEIGKINVSENTYRLIKNQFKFTDRGEYKIKNHGSIKMFFLEKLNLE